MKAPVVQTMDQAQPVKTRRLKLVLQDGRGIALESYSFDYAARVHHRGHRAQHIRITNADDAMEVDAIGRMWSWTFEYDNGVKSDKLFVPKDKPVKLNLISVDVNHALYIPAFRIKEDVTPGIDNYMWFEANELGSYDILCAEYCGLRHSYMITKLEVMEEIHQ